MILTLGVAAVSEAGFGQGMGPILLDNLDCVGNESSILSCNHLGIGIHNCIHYEDAGLICSIGEYYD